MKATGITRGIDSFGRVEIPEGIRRKMKVHEGDILEIYLEEEGVLFRRYAPPSVEGIVKDLETEIREQAHIIGTANVNKINKKIREIKRLLSKEVSD